jgi:lipoprotein-releasing system permease protein
MKYEWFIRPEVSQGKRKQTFISIITVISIAGVMVGVMALIVVLAVMSGFEKTLKEKIDQYRKGSKRLLRRTG